MKVRWFVWFSIICAILGGLGTTIASANTIHPLIQSTQHQLRRCENNYDDEELAEMQSNGEDGYEPDDCPLLAHVLTGPMLLNFCQGGDEDWVKFKAKPDMVYQIRAEPPWNYPTEPNLDLFVDDVLTAQNDHYFNNNAEIWSWNPGGERWIYLRATELGGRHDCGNNAYTLTLHAFQASSFVPVATLTPTLSLTPTLTPTATPTQ